MSDANAKPNQLTAASIEVPEKKTLKDVVLDGLEEKGRGKDLWLW